MAVQTFRSLVLLLLYVVMADCDEQKIVVNRSSCRSSMEINVLEPVTMYIPFGQTRTLGSCVFQLASSSHEICIQLMSPLDCRVQLRYGNLWKQKECRDADLNEEYCLKMNEASVTFVTKKTFYLYNSVRVKVFQRDEVGADDDSGNNSGTSYAPAAGIAPVIFLLVVICGIAYGRKRRSTNSSGQAQSRPSQPYQTQPSAPSQPTSNIERNMNQPSRYLSQEFEHGNQPPVISHGTQILVNHAGYHTPATAASVQSSDYQLPPPSYEEAKNYPMPSGHTNQGYVGDRHSDTEPQHEYSTPEEPPPPYPGI